jgi:hypothetical protein
MLGADLGVLFNAVIPDFIVVVLFLIYICYILPKITMKAVAEHKFESQITHLKESIKRKN